MGLAMGIQVIAYPALSRAGLGNLLLPWARAEVFRHHHGLEMLAPQWTQPKIGPLLRRERDLRYYWRVFSNAGYITGLRRSWLLQSATQLDEDSGEEFMRSSFVARGRGSILVTFEGHSEEEWFDRLLGGRDFLRRRLFEMLSPPIRAMLHGRDEHPTIAVHVRRGDKVTVELGGSCAISNRTPSDEWFRRVIQSLRNVAGAEAPVTIFSDGKPGQLDALLALPNVSLAPPAPAIVDMLRMARARVVVTSGISTFSMWPAFLAQIPAINYPGTMARLNPDRPGWDIEATLGGELPATSQRILAAALSEPRVDVPWADWASRAQGSSI